MTETGSGKITTMDILVYLRQRLLYAIEQNDVDTLQNLTNVFSMLWNLVDEKKIQGGLGRILENFENAARDYAMGIGWKSIIPSEEEIRLALGSE